MIASTWWKVGLGLLGVTGLLASSGAGCGSSTSSSSSETTSTSSSGTGGGGTGGAGTGGGGTGGDSTTTGTPATSSGTTTTSSGSTTSSTGTGMVKYETCAACTDLAKGAPADECNATHDACFGNKNCLQLHSCIYDNVTGCTTDAAGACCTFACYEKLKTDLADPAAAQAAIDLYHAYDACLYCTTCTTQCDAQAYCAAYTAGPAACAP